MAAILGFFRTLFQGQLGFFADLFDRRVALRLAWVSFVVSLLVALYAAVNALISTIAVSMPNWILAPASWIIPDNLDACITAYFGARVLIFAFEWKYQLSAKLSF